MTNIIRNRIQFEVATPTTLVTSIPQQVYERETTSKIINDATQIIGTTHEQLALGDATDDLFCRIENLHATATVEVGRDISTVFSPLFKIPAGGPPAILPMLSTAANVYLQSSLASTPVRVTLCKLVDPV
jgi:hypothetical protein